MTLPQYSSNRPLTFDISFSLYQSLQALQHSLGESSISSVIRQAIKHFNFKTFEGQKNPHKQLSVRLPDPLKLKLVKHSQDKKVSMGELLRATLEALQDTNRLNQTRSKPMATTKPSTTTAKKAVKKAVTKAVKAVKKVVKKATKATKPTVKKAAKKAVAKKATTTKKAAPAKKAVAKKK